MSLEEDAGKFPERLRRLDRVFSSVRPFYFVTFNTYKKQPILAREEIHDVFRGFSVRAQEDNVAVGRYVIMPDHVHLFVALPPTEITLSNWIQMLKTVLGKQLLRLGLQKPHWQEGFFDHLLRSG
ncbi:MAG: transposase, partial [Chthoniobacterales bacterium]